MTADPLALANREELDRLRSWLALVESPAMIALPPDLGGRGQVETFAVGGSREWIEWRLVWNALYYVPPTATLLHGRAYGLVHKAASNGLPMCQPNGRVTSRGVMGFQKASRSVDCQRCLKMES